jgi:ABC-type Na+ efflux pump permease subunit
MGPLQVTKKNHYISLFILLLYFFIGYLLPKACSTIKQVNTSLGMNL